MTNKTIGILLIVYSGFMLGVIILFNESNVNIILIVFLMVCGFWLMKYTSKKWILHFLIYGCDLNYISILLVYTRRGILCLRFGLLKNIPRRKNTIKLEFFFGKIFQATPGWTDSRLVYHNPKTRRESTIFHSGPRPRSSRIEIFPVIV